ncbi:MAG: 50S ribosomal protein L11 methyltransferase, partial [Clostridia bacterium]|nr:50S ribosomal protein L11 methyltransferase [Clostridia bacterium]
SLASADNFLSDISRVIYRMAMIMSLIIALLSIILSGIIEPRGEEIYSALAENGYSVIDTKKENDWLAIIAEREKK